MRRKERKGRQERKEERPEVVFLCALAVLGALCGASAFELSGAEKWLSKQ
jgi:hypothetical protein